MTYTYEAGRSIYRDGKPFISIHAHGQYDPVEIDKLARLIARKVFNCDYEFSSAELARQNDPIEIEKSTRD